MAGGIASEKSGPNDSYGEVGESESQRHKQIAPQPDESEELALWIVAGLQGAYGEDIRLKIEERLGKNEQMSE